MDKSSRILNCDASSLLDLKAELYRKQEACKLAKAQQNLRPLKRMVIKGQDVTSKKKDKKLPEATEVVKDSYEEEMLQKSRKMLEAKSKIYDQIIEKKVALDDDFSDNYLVDFQRKELFECSSNDKTSDVSQNNSVGVTSSEKDDVIPSEDEATSVDQDAPRNVFPDESLGDESINASSNTAFGDKSKTPQPQNTDGPVHYQNVQFNEIRDHGVGYFGFSQEEKERQEQMELLISLRQETIESKQAGEKLKQKKQALLQSRLAKVCQRRNIDSSVLQVFTKEQENNETCAEKEPIPVPGIPADQSSSVDSDANFNPTPKKVRPWDIGKSNFDSPVQGSKKRQSGAEKWLENKRQERNEEFAPPAFYFSSTETPSKKLCKDT